MSANEEKNEETVTMAENGGSKVEQSADNGSEETSDTKADPPKEESSSDSKEVQEVIDEFESPPDDLNDFVVLDEAEFSDDEEEEPEEDEKQTDGKSKWDDEDGKQWDCSVHQLAPRTYKRAELEPIELDPRCKPDFPLGMHWPVYVGNFMLPKRNNSDFNLVFTVHKYFASKGLPAFMVFRKKDDFFEEYQKRTRLYDMLVYFINKKDANRAVNWCHGDMYYGHRLRVYSGRSAMQAMSLNKTTKTHLFKLRHLVAEDKLETESSWEKYLSQYGQVLFISKQNLDYLYVQLKNQPNRSVSIRQDPRFEATPVQGPIRKQRFIEEDVEESLLQEVTNNPRFMRMRVRPCYLNFLRHGVIPQMQTPWTEVNMAETNRSPNPVAYNPRSSKEVFPQKRRHEYNGDGKDATPPKSRRQLLREARQLEQQLRDVQSKIGRKFSQAPMEVRKAIPGEMKPKRQKTEAQLIKQRIRQARRFRRQPNFDPIIAELDALVQQ